MAIIDKIEQLLSDNKPKIGNEAIAAAMEAQRKAQSEGLVNALSGVLYYTQRNIDATVTRLRKIRAEEKHVKSHIASLDRARLYMLETGNPLPLHACGIDVSGVLAALGATRPSDINHADYKIPDDWKPASEQ